MGSMCAAVLIVDLLFVTHRHQGSTDDSEDAVDQKMDIHWLSVLNHMMWVDTEKARDIPRSSKCNKNVAKNHLNNS
jgi:hypothetical protein